MGVFALRILSSLTVIALMLSRVVTERVRLENNTGNSGRTLDAKNNTKDDCNRYATGARRIVQYVYNNPALQCYTQFFVNGQPPTGLRQPNNPHIRYICQPPTPNQQAQQTFYATMFDEQRGIAVFAVYTLAQNTVQFGERENHPFCQTPGIVRQGSAAIYRIQQPAYVRGHLVPSATYSSSQNRYDSTYTYTNCVPQRPQFNTGMWSQFERRIRRYATDTCTRPLPGQPGQPGQPAGTLHLVTGTSFVTIQQLQNGNPQSTNAPVNQYGNPQRGQIEIPNSLWTAGCCVRQNGQLTGSFAVMGNNVQNNNNLRLTMQVTVAQLQTILAADVNHLNIGGPNVVLFPGDPNCLNNDLGALPNPGVGR